MGWGVIATDLDDVIQPVLAPNISRNRAHLPSTAGAIEVRVLDWSVSPDQWVWDHPSWIASRSGQNTPLLESQSTTLTPPFDLVISSDTLYSPELVTPLLRTLHSLCRCSAESSPDARFPQVFICLERRDPSLIDRSLAEARGSWDFQLERIPHKRIVKAMEKGGVRWEKDQWDDVEIWKLTPRV